MKITNFHIETSEEFNTIMQRGINPLFDPHFSFDIDLRINIQRQFFGHSEISKGDIVQANNRFYQYMWKYKKHYCEECLKPLNNYSSAFVSHILSRGAFPEMAHDVRNINILCLPHHNQWENGKRETMRIFLPNLKTIKILKKEYANSKEHEKEVNG